jgi:mannitol/fructose-specific phosphotransferase system IIA component (Ntr-type)
MKLSELLREGQILTGFQARDKWEALSRIADLLVSQGRGAAPLRAAVHDALVAREKVASTGMEFGVALPHAPVDGLEEALGALALSPPGIDFRSADGQPARIIVALAIPRKAVQKHIPTLAGIARLLNFEEFRDSLLRARSPREALQLVRAEEQQHLS